MSPLSATALPQATHAHGGRLLSSLGARAALVLFLQLLAASASQAQVLNLKHYTNRDGLPQTQVLALLQDSDGYMWIGTYGGLSRFNGRDFKTYTSDDGLPRSPFDIVLMDCEMPEMDGLAATAMIREREGDAHRIPIIAVTASTMKGDKERCLAAGMDDYLAKPLEQDDLMAILERWSRP